jgi:circadian clock protein KaiB
MNADPAAVVQEDMMPTCVLKLYVTGNTPRSSRAIANLHRICDELLPGQCELIVIDALEQPQAANEDHILVTPTLIRQLPLPPRRVLGDLSDAERVLRGLDLFPERVQQMGELPASQTGQGSE